MRINTIELENFGCLRDQRFELSPGLNVVKGPNEAGKSTLQAAILTAFFAKPDTSDQEVLARRSWGTEERFRLRLDLTTPEGPLRLEKDFQARTARLEGPTQGAVLADVNAVQAALETDLGLRGQPLFQSTACFPQEQIANIERGRDQIAALLEQQVTGTGDAGRAEEALRDLGEAIRKLSVGLHDTEPKRPGPIRRLRDEVAHLGQELAEAEASLGSAEGARQSLGLATSEAEALQRDLAVKRSLLEKARQRAELERDLSEATERRDALAHRFEQVDQLRKQREQAAQRAQQMSRIAEEGPGALTRIAELEAAAKERDEEAHRARQELHQVEEAEASAPPPIPIFNTMTIVGLVLVALAAIGGFLVHSAIWAGALPGLALTLWGLLKAQNAPKVDYVQLKTEAAKRIHAAEEAARQSHDTAHALLTDFRCQTGQELQQKIDEADEAWKKVEQLRAEIRGLLADSTRQELQADLERAQQERRNLEGRLADPELEGTELSPEQQEALRQEIARAESRLDQLQREAQDSRDGIVRAGVDPEQVSALRERLSAAQERLQAHERRLAVYTSARDAIAQARGETLRQATDVLAPRLGELLAPLTGGRYSRVGVDERTLAMDVWSEQKGDSIPVGVGSGARRQRMAQAEMSSGTRGQVFLAARLALVDLIWPDQRPPLLLDDPLVSFDPQRRQAAIAILKQYARGGQVILFTCSDAYDSAADSLIQL